MSGLRPITESALERGLVPRLHHDSGCKSGKRRALHGQGSAMKAQFNRMADEEYEVQLRNLARIVSVCTLGLWSFAAGLLIGTFLLF